MVVELDDAQRPGCRGEDVGDGQDAVADADLVLVGLGARAVLDVQRDDAVAQTPQQLGSGLAAHLGPVGVDLQHHLLGSGLGEHLERRDAVDAVLELEGVVVVPDAQAVVGRAVGDGREGRGGALDALAGRPVGLRHVRVDDRRDADLLRGGEDALEIDVLTDEMHVRRRGREAEGGQMLRQLIRSVGEPEGLHVAVADLGQSAEGGGQILREMFANRVQLNRQFVGRHEAGGQESSSSSLSGEYA